MKVLESLGIEEYYQTLNTWMKILDDKNDALNSSSGKKDNSDDGKQRRRLKAK